MNRVSRVVCCTDTGNVAPWRQPRLGSTSGRSDYRGATAFGGATRGVGCGYFRSLTGACGPRAGLPGPVLGLLWLHSSCERTKRRSRIAWAPSPDPLGPDFGPFTQALRPRPAQNRSRKPGPGTGSMVEQPKVHFGSNAWFPGRPQIADFGVSRNPFQPVVGRFAAHRSE